MSDGPTVDISGLDKAAVLATLYNAASPHGKGFLTYDPTPMTVEHARIVIETRDDEIFAQARVLGHLPEHEREVRHCFGYLNGRPLHVDLYADRIEVGPYDAKHGVGMAQYALDAFRFTNDVNAPAIWQIHQEGVIRQAKEVWALLENETREKRPGDRHRQITLGFADVAGQLRPILTAILHPVGN